MKIETSESLNNSCIQYIVGKSHFFSKFKWSMVLCTAGRGRAHGLYIGA